MHTPKLVLRIFYAHKKCTHFISNILSASVLLHVASVCKDSRSAIFLNDCPYRNRMLFYIQAKHLWSVHRNKSLVPQWQNKVNLEIFFQTAKILKQKYCPNDCITPHSSSTLNFKSLSNRKPNGTCTNGLNIRMTLLLVIGSSSSSTAADTDTLPDLCY